MARTKLARFKVIATQANVIEAGKPLFQTIKGNWHAHYFKNKHDLIVEMGCGKGDYTVGMAGLFPLKNFIGVDIKGARLWQGSSMAREQGLTNVAFLRTQIQSTPDQFAPHEVSEIWLTFPDPRPKNGDAKRRLTAARFLNLYQSLVKPGGLVHLKTDDQPLFVFTLELLRARRAKNILHTFDLYQSDLQHHTLGIKTTYEKRFLTAGCTIKYLQYTV